MLKVTVPPVVSVTTLIASPLFAVPLPDTFAYVPVLSNTIALPPVVRMSTVFAVAACVVRSFTRNAASELTKMFPAVAVRFSNPPTDAAPPVPDPSASVCGVPVLVPRLAPLKLIVPAVAVSVEAPSFTLLTVAAPVVSLPNCTFAPVAVRLIDPEVAVVLVPPGDGVRAAKPVEGGVGHAAHVRIGVDDVGIVRAAVEVGHRGTVPQPGR